MGFTVIRFKKERQIRWGVVKKDRVYPVKGDYPLLGDFLTNGLNEAQTMANNPEDDGFDVHALDILNPVTPPCNIVCQGKNYSAHRVETGAAPERPDFNLLFYKASSALTGPSSKIVCPSHVRLLDYELELGLVIGREIKQAEKITQDNIGEFMAGLVMANDISARDVQIPQEQWFKGKSYRTFCPVGPYLYILDKSDVKHISDLQLTLKVNGEVRQSANTGQLLFPPAETLQEITELMDLMPGDLILTGTPGGVSLKVPGRFARNLMGMIFSDQTRMKMFVDSQLKSPRYLKNGDVIESVIRSSDGRIDLGRQVLEVVKKS